MREQNYIINHQNDQKQDSLNQIIILGILTLLSVLAPALLHTNQYEFIVLRFTGTLLDASYFDTALYASYLISGILAAVLSNKFGKRKLFVLVGSLGSSVLFIAMTMTLNYPLLIILRFLQGSFTVLCWQTLMTLALDISTVTNRGRNMGIFGLFLALSMGSGPVLGGVLAGIGVFVPYYTAALLASAVFLLALTFLKEPEQLTPKPSVIENINIIFREPRLIIPGIFNFVDRLHMGFILFILPLFLQIMLGVKPELRGMVLGLFALPFIILQYPIGKWSDKIGRYKILIIGSIIFGITLSVMGLLASFGLFMIILAFIILGISNGLTGPTAMALVGDNSELGDNAMAMGFFNLFGNVGMITGPLIGGLLLMYTNFVIAFIVAGSIELGSLIGVILIIKFVFKENPFKIVPITRS